MVIYCRSRVTNTGQLVIVCDYYKWFMRLDLGMLNLDTETDFFKLIDLWWVCLSFLSLRYNRLRLMIRRFYSLPKTNGFFLFRYFSSKTLLRYLSFCRWTPYGNTKCIICKQQVHQDGKYCHTCAYSKGKKITIPSLFLVIVFACY